MTKKNPSFNPDDARFSYVIHEFFTLRKDFIESQNPVSAKNLLRFLSDKEKLQLFIAYAIHNPHPTHDSVEDDIEQTELALKGWIEGTIEIGTVNSFLGDLNAWITKKS